MQAGSTGQDLDALGLHEQARIDAAEADRTLALAEAAAHAIGDGLWLLVDLLFHEELEAVQLDRFQVEGELLGLLHRDAVIEPKAVHLIGPDFGAFTVLQVHDPPGEGNDSGRIAGEDVESFPLSDDHRTAQASDQEAIRLVIGDEREAVGAFNAVQGLQECLFEAQALVEKVLNQMDSDLGIGLASKGESEFGQFGA